MRDHLEAIRFRMLDTLPGLVPGEDALPGSGVGGGLTPIDLWAPDPERLDPPYMSVEAPGWGPDPKPCMCGTPHAMQVEIRVRAVAGTPDGVAILLGQARGLVQGTLALPGRVATLHYERSEFIGLDVDATIPGTNRHPAVGVDSYVLHSRPA